MLYAVVLFDPLAADFNIDGVWLVMYNEQPRLLSGVSTLQGVGIKINQKISPPNRMHVKVCTCTWSLGCPFSFHFLLLPSLLAHPYHSFLLTFFLSFTVRSCPSLPSKSSVLLKDYIVFHRLAYKPIPYAAAVAKFGWWDDIINDYQTCLVVELYFQGHVLKQMQYFVC